MYRDNCADTQSTSVILCPLKTMRLSLWLILILAFSVGMCCAFALRTFHFEAKPAVVQTPEPKTKILVAKRTLPSGIEITADFLVFQEVALSEVPQGSLTAFAQAYRRQPAYPIPAGCPICEDLLVPLSETASQATFVPAGSQLISLDIVHVRQGDKVFPPNVPLSTVLSADQRIDIRVVPPETHGKLAEIKNEVLRANSTQDFKSSGELVLENVPVHRIQRQAVADDPDSVKDSLTLRLDKSEATKIIAAAKKGQIRILLRQEAGKQGEFENAVENVFEVAAQEQTTPVTLPFERPLSHDVHSASIHSIGIHSPLEQPSDQTSSFPAVASRAVASSAAGGTEPAMLFPAPVPPPEPSIHLPAAVRSDTASGLDPLDPFSGNSAARVSAEVKHAESVSVRNDVRNDATVTPAIESLSLRTIPTESARTAEQSPASAASAEVLQANEPGAEALSRPYTDAMMGPPRSTGNIQFLPPEKAISAKESVQEPVRRTPPAVIPPPPPPQEILSAMPAPAPLPVATSKQTATQKRTQTYTPFERRTYTIPSGDDSDELTAPPKLLKNELN